MKVSCLVLELMAMPAPRAVVNSRMFVPVLLNTAYPADVRTAVFAAGCNLYKSCSVCVAISCGSSGGFLRSCPVRLIRWRQAGRKRQLKRRSCIS